LHGRAAASMRYPMSLPGLMHEATSPSYTRRSRGFQTIAIQGIFEAEVAMTLATMKLHVTDCDLRTNLRIHRNKESRRITMPFIALFSTSGSFGSCQSRNRVHPANMLTALKMISARLPVGVRRCRAVMITLSEMRPHF